MIIKHVFARELSKEDYANYKTVFESVYGYYHEAFYIKKYKDNIYGDSLFLFAYDEDECVGIQVFWRNDLDGHLAYQSGDSAILKDHQGQGIFSLLVKEGVSILGNKPIIYGFPNNNSIHAFRKMGWHEIYHRKSKLFFKKDLSSIESIPDDYARWLLRKPSNHFIYSINGTGLIIICIGHHCYRILGKCNMTIFHELENVPSVKLPILFYHSNEGKYGIGNTLIVYKEYEKSNTIPEFKLDVNLM